jgi:hypothetical protein
VKFDSASAIFKRVLSRGSILIAGIAAVGGTIGAIIAGMPGLFSALIGAAMTFVFVTLTALSVWIGGRLPLGGFFGVVMGAWLVKLVSFIVVVRALQDMDWIAPKVLGFTLIAAILASLAVDAISVSKARQPIV